MHTEVESTFYTYYLALKMAVEASDRIAGANFSNFSSCLRLFVRWWELSSDLFAKHFYESENFQTLNNRMRFILGEPNLISLGAALQEAYIYATMLAEEYEINVEVRNSITVDAQSELGIWAIVKD